MSAATPEEIRARISAHVVSGQLGDVAARRDEREQAIRASVADSKAAHRLDRSASQPARTALREDVAPVAEEADDGGHIDIEKLRSLDPPPEGGPGSGLQAWRDYCAAVGLYHEGDATRDDLIAQVRAARTAVGA